MRLVFDTSSLNVSVGLYSSGTCVDSIEHYEEKHQQSKIIFQLIKDLLERNKISAQEIQELAVGTGPGSYTGLRVGHSVAKTWAFSMDIALYSFSSAKLLENTQTQEKDFSFPKVKYLEERDFFPLDEINELKPIYVNDHFG